MLTIIRTAVLVAAFGTTAAASAAPFDVRYESEAAGIQNTTATFSVGGVETFEGASTGSGKTLATDFGTAGAITGTYRNVQINNADQYGGAGGAGKYAVTFTSSGYSLDLTSTLPHGVDYFGYWLSALDGGNRVSFYSKGRLLFTFNPQDVIGAVNAHTDNAS